MTPEIISAIAAQHLAIVGKAGSGKTFTAKGIVETMIEQKRRICKARNAQLAEKFLQIAEIVREEGDIVDSVQRDTEPVEGHRTSVPTAVESAASGALTPLQRAARGARKAPQSRASAAPPRRRSGQEPEDRGLPGPQRRILDALAWWESVGIAVPTRVQIAVVAGYSPEGGAFQNPLGALRTAGMIEYPAPGSATLTAAGRAEAAAPNSPATTADLHAKVMAILDGPRRRILEPLLRAYPHPLTREKLAGEAGYSAEGGAFQNPLGALRSLGLIDYPERGKVVALPILFIGGRERARLAAAK